MDLLGVSEKTESEALEVLSTFKNANALTKSFDMKLEDIKSVWSDLFKLIRAQEGKVRLEGLNCARILSRDRAGINEAIDESIVSDLMQYGNIGSEEVNKDVQVTEESLKVLSNLLQQSSVVQCICTKNGFLSKLLSKMSSYPETRSLHSFTSQMFDFRLLFLFTALCPEQREIARHNHEAVEIQLKVIRDIIKEGQESVSKESALVICEVLKVVFSLTVNSEPEDTGELVSVARVLRDAGRVRGPDTETRRGLVNNIVNVCANLEGKEEPLAALLQPTALINPEKPDKLFENIAVNVLDSFLDFLMNKLECPGSSLKEAVSPCLSVLWIIARTSRPARKYLKTVILPPLTAEAVKSKPESSDSLKGRLVSLMTNSTTGDISTMVAELLYALCKENVSRLVKHTGYGNAAGLLARRGLMAGGRGGGKGNYSSDEESDTEDYREVKDQVNPISGCIDQPRANPLEGMSEEQKEYEAMQLVNLMDKMQRQGLISPARLGEDGRPEAVEHVLQLIEDRGQAEGASDQE